ncbi:2-phosphosulfolactate phosphatase [Gryllotalpicola koreensis]|uniref:Probable 2-phosphosulfolactate phosphatase n=1 Tax=Gryllotalpicola koreensis TaxID=993086 RepID=A0ABP8A4U4_9MICO
MPQQQSYEARFDWGAEGLRSIAPGAGVIVIVDVLGASDLRLTADSAGYGVPVVAADLRNFSAVARWVLARQQQLGRRANVAVVAAGERRPDGTLRPAVEDQLAAGAVIAALAALGIDACSPEAAVASAAFEALRPAVRHLLTASVTARELTEAGRLDDVRNAAQLDASDEVPIIHAGSDARRRPAE